jgi:hypothetical protein
MWQRVRPRARGLVFARRGVGGAVRGRKRVLGQRMGGEASGSIVLLVFDDWRGCCDRARSMVRFCKDCVCVCNDALAIFMCYAQVSYLVVREPYPLLQSIGYCEDIAQGIDLELVESPVHRGF